MFIPSSSCIKNHLSFLKNLEALRLGQTTAFKIICSIMRNILLEFPSLFLIIFSSYILLLSLSMFETVTALSKKPRV